MCRTPFGRARARRVLKHRRMEPSAFLIFMIIGAAVSGTIASGKNRSVAAWAVLGALLPLISAILVANLPANPAQPAQPVPPVA